MHRAATLLFALYALSMPVYCLARLAGRAEWTQAATLFTLTSWLACVSAHCVATRGLRRSSGSSQIVKVRFVAMVNKCNPSGESE